MKQHAQGSRKVIVTSPRDTQSVRSRWDELVARTAGENAQTFECTGDVGPFKTIEAMFTLNEYLNQVSCLKPIEVYARS